MIMLGTMQFVSQNYLERYLLDNDCEYAEFWADRLCNPYSDAHTQYLFKVIDNVSFSEFMNFLRFVEKRLGDKLISTTPNTQFDLLMEYLHGYKR